MRRSYDELVADNAEIKRALASGIEARLRDIPGVLHVTNGLKMRGGQPTDEIGITVYVREKRPERDIPPAERIPPVIDGIPTDVEVIRPGRLLSNNSRYRNVKGGIQISNDIVTIDAGDTEPTLGLGTFGCTATLDKDQTVVLLSCYHVLFTKGAAKSDWIYQPAPESFYVDPAQVPVKLGDGHTRIARIVDGQINTKIDAAIARLDLSTCCRCCGLDYDDEILALSDNATPPIPPTNQIVGTRPAVTGTTVVKVGAETYRTVGTVKHDVGPDFPVTEDGQSYNFVGQIQIVGPDAQHPFADSGDSGSIVVDEAGYAVGMVIGANVLSQEVYASHIADITSALGITIRTPGMEHLSGPRIAVPLDISDSTPRPAMSTAELYADSRARLLADPTGVWLWELADEHREEILALVTKHRPVTVAWHRAHGPAFFATAINTLRDGGHELPGPIHGMTLAESLARVGDALAAHGSPALRDAIAEHRDVLLESVRDTTTFEQVLDKLPVHQT